MWRRVDGALELLIKDLLEDAHVHLILPFCRRVNQLPCPAELLARVREVRVGLVEPARPGVVHVGRES